jgi:ATP-binding cassette subfamily A (ABC1) protein 5
MIAMLVVDTVLYLVLAWYIDNVKIGGSKNKYCFCFRSSYWGKQRIKNNALNVEELVGHEQQTHDFEREDQLKHPAVSIRQLGKKFMIKDQPFVAVDGFSLDMYENQIVALLGNR